MLKRSHLPNHARLAAALALALALLAGCSKSPQTANTDGRQILHFGNGTEPQDLDPQAVTGVPENKIVNALFEGLVAEGPPAPIPYRASPPLGPSPTTALSGLLTSAPKLVGPTAPRSLLKPSFAPTNASLPPLLAPNMPTNSSTSSVPRTTSTATLPTSPKPASKPSTTTPSN